MADGFLGRWSRRKLGGEQEEPPPAAPAKPAPEPAVVARAPGVHGGEALPAVTPAPGQAPAPEERLPPPSLQDVDALTPASDFRRFVGAEVEPNVRNAAMKKLFADPHYNVMDRMDVYIDDYAQPDPIPAAMLRSLASAQFLGMFRDETPPAEAAAQPRDDAEGTPPQSVAQSGAPAASGAPEHHADPDLRLQQDDAAGRADPGPEPG